MLKKISLLLSVILHPILATTYIFIVIFSSNSFVAFLPIKYKLMLTVFVTINTVILPLLLLVLLRRLNIVHDYKLRSNRERIFPLAISILPFLFTIFLFTRLQVPIVLVKILQAGIYILMVSAVISYFWKISLHLTGMGGITGFLLASALQGNQSAVPIFTVSIVLSGFLASARLIKGEHNPAQVYAGFLVGFTLVFLLFIK
ncbi:MAG: hypothetical protein AB1777_04350 [Bacteroidota bacterium]